MSPARNLTYDQLRAGDCLQVPDITTAWPDSFPAVPCTQPHTTEVFFTGNSWPQSLAYPGDDAITNQAVTRCGRAFTAYVGIPSDQSAFTYAVGIPDGTSWSSGDRWLLCIAYQPGGTQIHHSIKGSNQ